MPTQAILIIAYLVALCLTGFVTTALGEIAGIQAGNLIIDLLAGWMFLLWVFDVARRRWLTTQELYVALPLLIGSILIFLKAVVADSEPLAVSLQGVRAFILYALPTLYVLRLPPAQLPRVARAVTGTLLFLAVFGTLQGLLDTRLPQWLLTPPSDDLFGFYGSGNVRPTGLIGNPIIFSTVMVLGATWGWSRWLVQKRRSGLLLLAFAMAAIFLSLTRATMAGLIVALVLIHLLYRRLHPGVLLGLSAAVITLGLGFYQWLVAHPHALLTRRLLGGEASTQNSDIEHARQIAAASHLIGTHPILGVGIGSQAVVATRTVTDGYWWSSALELGLPLLVLLLVPLTMLLGWSIYRSWSGRGINRTAALALVGYLAYMVPASVVNSGGGSRPALALTWLVVGIMLARPSPMHVPVAVRQPRSQRSLVGYTRFVWRRSI